MNVAIERPLLERSIFRLFAVERSIFRSLGVERSIFRSLGVERSIFRSTDRTEPIGPAAAVDRKGRPLQTNPGQAAAIDLKVDRSTTRER